METPTTDLIHSGMHPLDLLPACAELTLIPVYLIIVSFLSPVETSRKSNTTSPISALSLHLNLSYFFFFCVCTQASSIPSFKNLSTTPNISYTLNILIRFLFSLSLVYLRQRGCLPFFFFHGLKFIIDIYIFSFFLNHNGIYRVDPK